MFIMKVPPDVELLIKQLEVDYPRAASNIRLMWSHEKEAQEFFGSLLHYGARDNKMGFNPTAFRTILTIRDRYADCLSDFLFLNKTEDEKRAFKRSLIDVWEKTTFYT